VLGRLDTSRKTAVMQFLEEAKLVREVDGREPVIALTGADLSGARGVTNVDLELQAFLYGATMPNGQKYEEWLKSTNREEGGKKDSAPAPATATATASP
jgi:hypothetical protein